MAWLAVWLVRSSSCPQQAGSSAVCRRAAAGPSSGFRQAVWLPAAAQAGSAEQASWSAPAVAWRPLAAAGMLPARELAPPSERQAGEAGSAKAEALVQPAASARRALSLRVEAAAVVCVQVAQPREAAAESGARGRPPEVAVAASGAAAEPQQEAVAAEPGAELQPGEAAAEAARAVGAAAGGGGGAGAGRGGAAAGGGGGGAAGALGAAAGGGAPGAGLFGFAVRAQLFLGLGHDERCGLRMRCGGRELRYRQSRCGKQHDAKVCHDVLGPRKNPGSNEFAFIDVLDEVNR